MRKYKHTYKYETDTGNRYTHAYPDTTHTQNTQKYTQIQKMKERKKEK